MRTVRTDIVIVGCGVAGLYCALNLPENKKITVVTKDIARKSDSFLAQGGICVLRDNTDYDAFYEDTMHEGGTLRKQSGVGGYYDSLLAGCDRGSGDVRGTF